MARPRSEDKRSAILEAAAKVFAERGLGAPTAAISRAAGVAEGTLFTYFSTKDELMNALYCEIKFKLANALMADFPRHESVRSRLEHIWNRYIEWGIENPREQKVLRQFEVWSGLSSASRKAGSAPFVEVEAMMEEAEKQHIVRDLPRQFGQTAMSALAEMVMELIRQDAKRAGIYRTAGFQMLWRGLTIE